MRHLTFLLTCLGLSACAALKPGPSDIWLLGEVHDNPAGHAQRAARLESALATGWRPAIVMEQFDRERQADLDAAMAACSNADCVIAKAAGAKWEWMHYKPLIDMALRYQLPLVAANLSRADAMKVARGDYAAALSPAVIERYALGKALPSTISRGQEQAIREGHCNQLQDVMLAPLMRAQVARDVVMAEALRSHSQQGAVLIAGNGHVRRDIGVPQWLAPHTSATLRVTGFVEAAAAPGEFDEVVQVAPHGRPDPCATLRLKAADSTRGSR